mmetsp:Transcript_14265/g.54019  ORF Transcript_14265/g.54019 Transcript_14265/m.54019 type:complete len:225 (-) Transcript_14265:1218-1892(-)
MQVWSVLQGAPGGRGVGWRSRAHRHLHGLFASSAHLRQRVAGQGRPLSFPPASTSPRMHCPGRCGTRASLQLEHSLPSAGCGALPSPSGSSPRLPAARPPRALRSSVETWARNSRTSRPDTRITSASASITMSAMAMPPAAAVDAPWRRSCSATRSTAATSSSAAYVLARVPASSMLGRWHSRQVRGRAPAGQVPELCPSARWTRRKQRRGATKAPGREPIVLV